MSEYVLVISGILGKDGHAIVIKDASNQYSISGLEDVETYPFPGVGLSRRKLCELKELLERILGE